jgi:transcriptional regulator with XRE-family HTH domain
MATDEQGRRNIAANVARLMMIHGMTQTALAEQTGETQATISRIVRGLNIPSATVLSRIASALDTTMDVLVEKSAENFSRAS